MAKMDKDALRSQVNQARRANYTNEQIIQFLSGRDERIGQALEAGHSPADVLNFLAPPQTGMETAGRMVGSAGRGAAPTAIATSIGTALGGAPGAVLGSLAYPATDALVQGVNTFMPQGSQMTLPSEGMRQILDRLGIGTPPETRGERMSQAAGEAGVGVAAAVPKAAGTKLPGAVGALVEEIGKAPLTQMITAPISGAASVGVGEATDNPIAAIMAGAVPGVAAGFRPRTRGTDITPEAMESRIGDAYGRARSAGVQVPIDDFASRGFQLDSKLREAGWRPESESLKDVTSMLETIKNQRGTKDIQDLMVLREQIKSTANPMDKNAYRVMKVMLDDFDDYLDNIPSNQFEAQGPDGIAAWRQGRDLFNKQRKAEVFDDMLGNMEFERSKFTMSGGENYLASELRKLAKNKKKMGLFSQSEQTAIKEAAKGGSMQNMLRYIGKFAPTGVIPGLSAVGLTAVDPMFATIPAAGALGRISAEQLRVGGVQRLSDMMRTGVQQPGLTNLMPATLSRGLLSTQIEEEE